MKAVLASALVMAGLFAYAADSTTEGLGFPPGHGQPGHPGQPGGGHGPGPGQPPYQPPPHQQPPLPPPQQPPHQQPPGWGGDYGPGVTRRWADAGTFKAPKVVQQDVTINTNGALLNEVALRVSNSELDLRSVYVYLYNGQIIDLSYIGGRIPAGRDVRSRLDNRYSLRTSRIVLRVSSPQVLGPSAKVQVLLGLAQ